MKKILRVTTVPISLKKLITGQPKFMSDNGFEVTLCSAEGDEINSVVEFEGCNHEVIAMSRQITPIQDLKALFQMIKLIRREKPDIIHTHTPKAGIVGMMAGKMVGTPHRIHTVAGLPLQVETGVKRKILEAVEKLTYLCATEVWPNSFSLEKFILDNKFTSSKKLKVIGKGSTNGIKVDEFIGTPDSEKLSKIKEKINYNPNNFYLSFVGRMVKDKGINELVRAFLRLNKELPDTKLILVGPLEMELDPLDREVLEIIESHNDIYAVGYSDMVKEYMSLSDLFVFPSHREGFPNVPMQAALQDSPVLASRITGNVDIIDENINGLLHNVEDEEDLFQKMKYACQNPQQMKIYAQSLKDKILNNYRRKDVQNLILQEYKRMTNV